jgi:nucleotide-binding universal stress UspA family protein
MTRRVLVPIDGSDVSTRALEYALDVHADDELTLLYVAGEPSPMMGAAAGLALDDDFEDAAREEAEDVFGPARDLASERGVEVDTEVGIGSPAKTIVSQAENYDVVVLGSHSGGLRKTLFVGNVADRVVKHAPCPVTVVR